MAALRLVRQYTPKATLKRWQLVASFTPEAKSRATGLNSGRRHASPISNHRRYPVNLGQNKIAAPSDATAKNLGVDEQRGQLRPPGSIGIQSAPREFPKEVARDRFPA